MWLLVSVCTCSHLPSWKRSDSLESGSQIQEDQCSRESREFLMTVTYSDCSPWANVALAVVQQSSIAKLGSPRKIKRSLAIGGSLQREYHRMSRPKWKGKAKSSKRPRLSSKQMSTHRHGVFKGQTLLSPAADALSSDARSPSQLRRMCRVVCEKPGCRRQSSVAVCDAAREM